MDGTHPDHAARQAKDFAQTALPWLFLFGMEEWTMVRTIVGGFSAVLCTFLLGLSFAVSILSVLS